jgi:hypothetical protein
LTATRTALLSGVSAALLGSLLFTGTAGAAAKSGATCATVGAT